jgi:hypothetical protein
MNNVEKLINKRKELTMVLKNINEVVSSSAPLVRSIKFKKEEKHE